MNDDGVDVFAPWPVAVAASSVQRLISLCESGYFYRHHDQSRQALRDAAEGLAALVVMAGGVGVEP